MAGKSVELDVLGARQQPPATEPGRDGREEAHQVLPFVLSEIPATEPGRDGREEKVVGFYDSALFAPQRSPAVMAGKSRSLRLRWDNESCPQRSPAVMAGKSRHVIWKEPLGVRPQRSPAVMAGKRRRSGSKCSHSPTARNGARP